MTLITSYGRSLRAKFLFLAPLLTLGLALGLAQSPDSRAGTLTPRFTVYGAQVDEPIHTKTALARQVGRPDNNGPLSFRSASTVILVPSLTDSYRSMI